LRSRASAPACIQGPARRRGHDRLGFRKQHPRAELMATGEDRGGRLSIGRLLQPGSRHAAPIMLLLLLGFAAPLLAIVGFSFGKERTFALLQTPTFESYGTIIEETFYYSFLWSLGMAVATVIILVLICYPVAYGLAKIFGRWAN